MPDTKFRRRVKIIVPVLSMAVVASFCLAAWSFYSSVEQACSSRNQTLNVLSDVVDIAIAPQPGTHLTKERARRVEAFRTAVQARIDKARC